jgi:hypothetical protein
LQNALNKICLQNSAKRLSWRKIINPV